MVTCDVHIKPLTSKSFSEFGEVIETEGRKSYLINDGMCERYDHLAEIKTDHGEGKPIISIFRSNHYKFPIKLKLLEKHPKGSQAFMPLHNDPFLVIVATEFEGCPSNPQVFITNGYQGINLYKNTWHGVLTPILKKCDFLVIDRTGETSNLIEFFLQKPMIIDTEFPINPSKTLA